MERIKSYQLQAKQRGKRMLGVEDDEGGEGDIAWSTSSASSGGEGEEDEVVDDFALLDEEREPRDEVSEDGLVSMRKVPTDRSEDHVHEQSSQDQARRASHQSNRSTIQESVLASDIEGSHVGSLAAAPERRSSFKAASASVSETEQEASEQA